MNNCNIFYEVEGKCFFVTITPGINLSGILIPMVENKLITSEFEQNMLKEEELKCKNELPPVQTFQTLNAERVQRHRLNKRLWSLRRQSSEFESSLYNSSSCGSASSDPSNGSSSSNSTSS